MPSYLKILSCSSSSSSPSAFFPFFSLGKRGLFPLGTLVLLSFLLLLPLSCSKWEGSGEDPASPAACTSSSSNIPTKAVTISLRTEGGTKGSGDGSGSGGSSATIGRVDVYEYDASGTFLEHFSLGSEDIQYMCFSRENSVGTVRLYYIVANLSPSCASYLEGFPLSGLCSEEAMIPLSQSGYSSAAPLLAGTVRCDFTRDGTVPVDLYRYMFKVSVGTITLDLENTPDMGKDVFVRSVSLINTAAVYKLTSEESLSNVGQPRFLFGPTVSPEGGSTFFGGLTSGYRSGPEGYVWDGTLSLEGDVLSGTYPIYQNLNYKKGRGVLYVDAVGDALTDSYYGFDNGNGEGRIGSSTDPGVSHTIEINRAFMGIPQTPYLSQYTDIVSEYDTQGFYPRLVIEIDLDGKTLFYPLGIICPQPGTHYLISDITLHGRGSDYSNFIERTYRMEVTMSVRPWTETTLSNMDLGYQGTNKYSLY